MHATEILQEGLCLPTLKLYDAGKPNTTLLKIIEKNTRQPVQVLGDLKAQLAACSIGGAQFCLDRTVEYMRERKQFGSKLSDFQALRFRVADYATELEASRLMVRRAALAVTNKEPNGTRLAAMAKRLATDAGFEVVNGCLQLHGGYGYLRDHPIERVLRDVRVHQILEGTNEVMRLIVSRDMLDN